MTSLSYAQAYAIVKRRLGEPGRLWVCPVTGRCTVGRKHRRRIILLGSGDCWDAALRFAGMIRPPVTQAEEQHA